MDNENIIENIKQILQISYEVPLTDLYNRLWDYRNNFHPDKFLTQEAKTKGEKNFKHISSLLSELHKIVEEEKLEKTNSQIIPFDNTYEIIKLKQVNSDYDCEINDLKTENDYLKSEINERENRINNLISNKAKEKEDELMLKYKSSRKSVISIGIILTLTALISILTKIEEVTNIITKYSPIDDKLLNLIIFIVFILTILICIIKYFERNYINKISNIVQTSLFIKNFLLTLGTEKDYFNEFDVIKYISRQLAPRNKVKRTLMILFKILSTSTLESLKDIFIYHLYEKSLIEFHDAHCLDRYFKIKKSYHKGIQNKSTEINEMFLHFM